MHPNIQSIHKFIAPERAQLLQHPLYQKIQHIQDLQLFTEGHVYAVWDFMSLLKALQVQLTCTTLPWLPSAHPNTRYLINEIVLAEESDEQLDGRRLSHYEMYLEAMSLMGANTAAVEQFLASVVQHGDIRKTIEEAPLDARIKAFLTFSFDIIATQEPHKIASAFTFGREDLIPAMFTSILTEIQQQFPTADLAAFIYYFERHIALDADEHGPLAMQMIEELGGNDASKWADMESVAKEALLKRIALWDAIEAQIEARG